MSMTDDPPKIDTGSSNTTDLEYLFRGDAVNASLENNPELTKGWAPGMPTPADYKAATEKFRAACYAVKQGGKNAAAARKAARAEFLSIHKKIANQIGTLAIGNPGIVEATGFELKKARQNNVTHDPMAPKPVVSHGLNPGEIYVKCQRLPGVGGYEGQATEGLPTDEAGYKQQSLTSQCSHIVMTNLQSAKQHYVRLRGIYANAPGPWSLPIPIVVL